MFFENNPFEAVKKRTDLNGLEKLREAIRLNQTDKARTDMTVQSIPLTYSPRVLVGMIDSNRRILTPYFLALIEEGNRDGSIHTDYPREIAELLPLLTSLWLLPSVFPATRAEMRRKFSFSGRYAGEDGRAAVRRFDPHACQRFLRTDTGASPPAACRASYRSGTEPKMKLPYGNFILAIYIHSVCMILSKPAVQNFFYNTDHPNI